jgi:phosphoenolpyruvate synthase/pyruvate phosphate dikinase
MLGFRGTASYISADFGEAFAMECEAIKRDPAVKAMLQMAIKACLEQGKYVGICGQGPSDHPDFAQWLADLGISAISLEKYLLNRPRCRRSQPL